MGLKIFSVQVPADNFTLNTQLVKGDEDPVASAITSLSRYQKSRCQPEHQNWGKTKSCAIQGAFIRDRIDEMYYVCIRLFAVLCII